MKNTDQHLAEFEKYLRSYLGSVVSSQRERIVARVVQRFKQILIEEKEKQQKKDAKIADAYSDWRYGKRRNR